MNLPKLPATNTALGQDVLDGLAWRILRSPSAEKRKMSTAAEMKQWAEKMLSGFASYGVCEVFGVMGAAVCELLPSEVALLVPHGFAAVAAPNEFITRLKRMLSCLRSAERHGCCLPYAESNVNVVVIGNTGGEFRHCRREMLYPLTHAVFISCSSCEVSSRVRVAMLFQLKPSLP